VSRDYQVSWPYKSRPHFTKTARQRAASDGRVIVSHDPFLSRKARRRIPPTLKSLLLQLADLCTLFARKDEERKIGLPPKKSPILELSCSGTSFIVARKFSPMSSNGSKKSGDKRSGEEPRWDSGRLRGGHARRYTSHYRPLTRFQLSFHHAQHLRHYQKKGEV